MSSRRSMKYFLIYAFCLAVSMFFVDIESENILFSIFAPIGIGVFILLIIIWLVLKGAESQNGIGNADGAPYSSDGDCGGGGGDC